MRRDTRGRTFPTSRLRSWLGDRAVWPWLLAATVAVGVVLVALFPISVVGLGLALVIAWVLWICSDPERLDAWQVTPAGLIERQRDGRRREHRWPTILEVAETTDAVLVATEASTLRFEGRAKDRALLAQEIRARLARLDSEPATIPPAQIAAWLGIGLDDSLRLERPLWKRIAAPLGWIAAFVTAAVVWGLRGSGFEHFWVFMMLPFLFDAARSGQRGTVLVTLYGLQCGKVRFAWDAIDACGKYPAGFYVTAGGRTIVLVGPDGRRVAGVIGQVLEARDRGAILPRMTDVPDHALSRAESVEVSAERGISVAEDGQR